MNWPDIVNASFEWGAAGAIALSIRRLFIEKVVKGYDPVTIAFFTVWGAWNIYFYGPALGLLFSWVAGVAVFVTNCVWLYYAHHFLRWPGGREEYLKRTEELLS